MSILTHYIKDSSLKIKTDIGEKLAHVGLGLIRLSFGQSYTVKPVSTLKSDHVFFEEKAVSLAKKVVALALAFFLSPVVLIGVGIGLVGLAFSKSYKDISATFAAWKTQFYSVEFQKKLNAHLPTDDNSPFTLQPKQKFAQCYAKSLWKLGDLPLEIGEVPPLPENIEALMSQTCPFDQKKKIYDTHQLFFFPASFSSIQRLTKKIKKKGIEVIQDSTCDKVFKENAYWALIHKGTGQSILGDRSTLAYSYANPSEIVMSLILDKFNKKIDTDAIFKTVLEEKEEALKVSLNGDFWQIYLFQDGIQFEDSPKKHLLPVVGRERPKLEALAIVRFG